MNRASNSTEIKGAASAAPEASTRPPVPLFVVAVLEELEERAVCVEYRRPGSRLDELLCPRCHRTIRDGR
jgi:hypothetical protein